MITIKMDHTEIVSEYVSWIHLAQDRSIAAHGKKNLRFPKCGLDSSGSGYDLSGYTVMKLQVS
jgi:hypothetical protein